jgi:uroporphyrin-3 C-methyltransferase/uroporphyrinogen III methyltransferase/synthase
MMGVSSAAPEPHPNLLPPAVVQPMVDPALARLTEDLRRTRRSLTLWLVVGFVVALAIAIGLWFLAANRLDRSEREFARRIQDDGIASRAAQELSRQVQDQAIANTAKVGALEARVADSQSQQASLEQLYSDLARTRDDWALAEVEQILAVASQQLQLAGNVQGATIALQNADQRLARTDRPQFIMLRRAIAKDLERLRTLPSVDIAGNALRIDSLIGMVDALPMLSDERPQPRTGIPVATTDAKPADASAAGWFERLQLGLRSLANDAWQRFGQLVRVRDVREPDALLLTPNQSYFVRENLKLRLLNARLALLARQEATYRADLANAQVALQKYFDGNARQTQAALALLKQVQSANTVIDVPTLADSLAAARSVKGQR